MRALRPRAAPCGRPLPAGPATGRPAAPRRAAVAAAAAAAADGAAPDRWAVKRKQILVEELAAAARKARAPVPDAALLAGVEQLEGMVPGLQMSTEAMRAADWLKLVTDPSAAAARLVALRSHYPGADLCRILQERPAVLLKDIAALEADARQVHSMLSAARDRDALLTALPLLLEPRTLASVLITVDKWYFGARDPIEVLEEDPEMLRRAMICDVPLEPVFDNADGSLSVPKFNYREKRADWQAAIDAAQPRQHWGAPVKSLLEVD
ncbi:hypothetical protein Rsub_10930 [Raphidocelis subcapitata]|uniref:Uncharacterized protein n=1 Tax=Raphidocelis subcapitata TaxID=307507 RepID=A0A2V0PLP0_9CHLO|nr:hypothetical protein Rsub_10930 [Raphidocelis subcapitata]|eukprot:GBF98267.1 hypothetical protein Rsub_10930 [Raphidocelis subcapitata]